MVDLISLTAQKEEQKRLSKYIPLKVRIANNLKRILLAWWGASASVWPFLDNIKWVLNFKDQVWIDYNILNSSTEEIKKMIELGQLNDWILKLDNLPPISNIYVKVKTDDQKRIILKTKWYVPYEPKIIGYPIVNWNHFVMKYADPKWNEYMIVFKKIDINDSIYEVFIQTDLEKVRNSDRNNKIYYFHWIGSTILFLLTIYLFIYTHRARK